MNDKDDGVANCDVLSDLTLFVQIKKREIHPWRSVTLTLLHGCFSRFLICTNGTKLRNASHMDLDLVEIKDKSEKLGMVANFRFSY